MKLTITFDKNSLHISMVIDSGILYAILTDSPSNDAIQGLNLNKGKWRFMASNKGRGIKLSVN